MEAVESVIDEELQAELARERALGGVERAVRELAANFLSIVRGSGNPEMIEPQAQAVVHTMEAHRSIAGRIPASGEIAAVLNIAAKEERVALLNIDQDAELLATQTMISEALTIAAARLADIRSHDPGGVEGLTEDDYGGNLPSKPDGPRACGQ